MDSFTALIISHAFAGSIVSEYTWIGQVYVHCVIDSDSENSFMLENINGERSKKFDP